MAVGLISVILKRKKRINQMTIRQLLEKQKYRSKITISYFSAVAGCDVDETYYPSQFNIVLAMYGHRIIDNFYIAIDPGPDAKLVIEMI